MTSSSHTAKRSSALAGLSPRERERIWYSLAGKRRRPQLAAVLGIPDEQISDLVARVRKQCAQLGIGRG